MKISNYFLIAVGGAVIGAASGFAFRAFDSAKPPEIPSPVPVVEEIHELPAFSYPDLDGRQRSSNEFSDKVVVLNFWATWCPPCIEEMPSMRRLHQRFATHPDFEMLAVSTDESWAPVRELLAKEPPGFEVLLDPGGAIAKQYGTTVFPETYVLVDGQIVAFIEGPRDWDAWFAHAYLEGLLGPAAGGQTAATAGGERPSLAAAPPLSPR